MIRPQPGQHRIRRLVAATTAVMTVVAVAGCGGSAADDGSVSAGGTIVLGISAPQTGPLAINSQAADGLEAYFKKVNEAGGVAGYTVETNVVDNQGTVNGGAQSVRTLLSDDPFAVSVVSSGAFTGATSVLRNQPDMPVLALSSGAAIDAADLDTAYGLFTDYTTESFAAIDALTEMGHSELALVYDPTFAQESADSDAEYADEKGAELVESIQMPSSSSNYTPAVQKIRSSGADGVILQVAQQGVAGLRKAAQEAGLDVPMVAYSGNLDAGMIELAGQAADGLYVTGLFPLLNDSSPAVKEFRDTMEQYKPGSVSVLGMVGWNAGALIEAGIQRAAESEQSLTSANFLAALDELGGQSIGVLDQVGWTEEAHDSLDGEDTSTFTLYQVQDGDFVKVE